MSLEYLFVHMPLIVCVLVNLPQDLSYLISRESSSSFVCSVLDVSYRIHNNVSSIHWSTYAFFGWRVDDCDRRGTIRRIRRISFSSPSYEFEKNKFEKRILFSKP